MCASRGDGAGGSAEPAARLPGAAKPLGFGEGAAELCAVGGFLPRLAAGQKGEKGRKGKKTTKKKAEQSPASPASGSGRVVAAATLPGVPGC